MWRIKVPLEYVPEEKGIPPKTEQEAEVHKMKLCNRLFWSRDANFMVVWTRAFKQIVTVQTRGNHAISSHHTGQKLEAL